MAMDYLLIVGMVGGIQMIYYLPILAVTVCILLFLRKIELLVRSKKKGLYVLCVFLQLAISLVGLTRVEIIIFGPNIKNEFLNDYLMYQTILFLYIIVIRQLEYYESIKDKKSKIKN